MRARLYYFSRIFSAYFFKRESGPLSFWHENPQTNEGADFSGGSLGQYYMAFSDKAGYKGSFDQNGIPLLDYHGKIGKQYNPIAISQYGLAHYNLYKKTGDKKSFEVFLKQTDWLVLNLEKNPQGLSVWMHRFDFEYKKTLKAPWYSALAQGQGISLLCRAYAETNDQNYLNAAKEAFLNLNTEIKNGGVKFIDESGDVWLEEYIVEPPTHILNGFIWALWGVYDYWLLTKEESAKELFDDCSATIKKNLLKYDIGFWSLYDLSQQLLKNIASPFYHKLHIVQLMILSKMISEEYFSQMTKKWEKYQKNLFNKSISILYKSIFKIFYW